MYLNKSYHILWRIIILIASSCAVHAEDINLQLAMPSHYFAPGSSCALSVHCTNTGTAYPEADLFVALNVGTSDYWFYPSWAHFPNSVDFQTMSIPALSEQDITIFPEFVWPSIQGEFSDAVFYAAMLSENALVSNVNSFSFGWVEKARLETITPPKGAPGAQLVVSGIGFNLTAENIRIIIGAYDLPTIAGGVNEQGKEFVISAIPPLNPGSYQIKLMFDQYESTSMNLEIEPLAPTGKPLGQVIDDVTDGMAVLTDTLKNNIIPDAADCDLIPSDQLSVFQDEIDRNALILQAFCSELQKMSQDQKEYFESLLVQSNLDKVFSELTQTLEKYQQYGSEETDAAHLAIIIDLTSACLSMIDALWSTIDFGTAIAAIIVPPAGAPAVGGSFGIHIEIQALDAILDYCIASRLIDITQLPHPCSSS